MKVTVLAQTRFEDMGMTARDGGFSWTDTEDADLLAEFAGRSCYESWNRPNPKTRENADYLKHILEVGHESVLEHATVTFYIEGVSRALTHELIRHRMLSYSQASQRFIKMDEAEYVLPPAIKEDSKAGRAVSQAFTVARSAYRYLLDALKVEGDDLKVKQIREAARAVLPNCTSTSIVVTGNHRAWRDVIKKRWHVAADAEIRELAGLLLTHLRKVAPGTYQDIPDQPYEYGT